MAEKFDVIVLGAGPAGSSAAVFLSRAGHRVLLLDRAKFPREKVCGDGISGRSVSILTELGLLDEYKKVEHREMAGVTFSSPDGTVAPIPSQGCGGPPGFVCRREVFDNVLFQHAKKLCTQTIEGFNATDLVFEGGRVCGVRGMAGGRETEFRAAVVVGADGAGGITARKLNAFNSDEAHQCAALRCYYEGVEGMRDHIELHFVEEALPGYFWIFPLPGNRANVGIGMIVRDMKKKKINLQKTMFSIIEKHPVFRERFRNARRVSDVKSWMLPFASRRAKIAGDGYVLVGDAASLVDPFTGEGVGNALTSGKLAARAISEALHSGDTSGRALSSYPAALFQEIGPEVETNYKLQRLINYPFLLNMTVGKVHRSAFVRGAISDALLSPANGRKLTDPMFLLKVLLS